MSYIEALAAKVILGSSGAEGTHRLIIADDDKFVTSTNMKVGAYTVAAQPAGPTIVGVLATAVGTADTMGTVTIIGTGADGAAITEVVIPIAGTTVSTLNSFLTITSITGAGWVIDVGNGNDTIKVGAVTSGAGVGQYFSAVQAITDTVVASQTNLTGFASASMVGFTKIPSGHVVPCKCTKINLTSGEAIAYIAKV